MDDAGGNGQLAFHTLGIAAELAVRGLVQVEQGEQFPCPLLPLGPAHAVQAGAEAEVGEAAQLRIEVALVRDHADAVLGGTRVAGAVDAVDAHLARVRPRQADEHVDGGGLAGAVRTEKAKQLAAVHVEIQSLDRLHLAEPLAQAAHADGEPVVRVCRHPPSPVCPCRLPPFPAAAAVPWYLCPPVCVPHFLDSVRRNQKKACGCRVSARPDQAATARKRSRDQQNRNFQRRANSHDEQNEQENRKNRTKEEKNGNCADRAKCASLRRNRDLCRPWRPGQGAVVGLT